MSFDCFHFNSQDANVYFDTETREGEYAYTPGFTKSIEFKFSIEPNAENEIMLFIGDEQHPITEVREIRNKIIRAELVAAFESIIEEERLIRDSFFQPDPDFNHDNRNI